MRAAEIDGMAKLFGVKAPSAGPWLQMFTEVTEQLPHAVAVTDMKTPGLPVTACNSAMVKLTGYPREHIVGRNCRFMQGKRTEAAAVRAMVAGIRGAKPTTVRVTNYRKDGSMFTNMLTLSPIMDSSGAYRYNVGILADAANGKSESAGLEKLRGALPKTMPAQA